MRLRSVVPAGSRRRFLQTFACGFGALALDALCAEESAAEPAVRPLAPRTPHFRPRAKRVIFLFMAGGISQVDLWDHKPRLVQEDGAKWPFAVPSSEVTNGRVLGPISPFRPRGQSGLMMSDLMPNLAGHADEMCLLRGMVSDSPNHFSAIAFLNTGALNDLRPSMGSWITYGLGTENQDLPGYLTILPREGLGGLLNAQDYSSAFLPAIFQGTAIQSVGTGTQAPIRNLADPAMPAKFQRQRLDLMQTLNRRHLERLVTEQQVEGMIESFELAFRMQAEAPKLVDLSTETKATLEQYGIGQEPTDQFGRQCLLARRFAEAGVRFIQVSLNGWDHHSGIRTGLPKLCTTADKPIAGLLADLKARGLLDDTLVLCSGEFGRMPFSQKAFTPKGDVGRDHGPHGFTAWLAGGGVKGGIAHGQTDEFGYRAIDGKVHVHDLHATLLHLLGLDHEKLTYNVAGRPFRLTDVAGHVVQEIIS